MRLDVRARRPVVLVAAALLALAACSSRPTRPPPASAAHPSPSASAVAPAPSEGPLEAIPYTPGLDVTAMDATIDPCVDLYAYACAGWQRKNPIPADRSKWDVYAKLTDQIERRIWGLLLEAARAKPGRSPVEAQVGTYFTACMDEAGIDAKGKSPLDATLTSLAEVRTNGELARWLAEQEVAGNGGTVWSLGTTQDSTDAAHAIVQLSGDGLSLPERGDYFGTDPKSVELRAKLVAHIEQLLVLAGDDPKTASETAAITLRIETAFAKVALTPTEERDPANTFHRMTPAQLAALAPRVDWKAFFGKVGLGSLAVLDVAQPRFFEELDATLRREPLDAVKRWIRWRVVDFAANYLSRPFVDEHFAFHAKYLRGTKELAPRWRRCVGRTSSDLGEAVGELFVENDFAPGVKARAEALVAAIEAAMEAEIQELSWMSAPTKKEALNKLHTVRNKIGHPAKFRDYASVTVVPDDYFGNVRRASAFDLRWQLAKLGKPLDRDEWDETPQTVDAFYSQHRNDINFTAAVLMPPLFDPKMDDAPNYGNMGATVGHELIHAFDDAGRKFDAHGNLRDWWTPADAKTFETRASCLAKQFSSYVAVDEVHVNGDLTLGENIADLAGLVLAYRAWAPTHASEPPRDGLTPPQRFFVGYAQWVCSNVRPEQARVAARVGSHAPPRYRINGAVVNMPEYAQAFSCKPGQPMVKPASEICTIW